MESFPRKNVAEISKGIDRIGGLETAANAHIEWLRNFHRILVCGLKYSEDLVADNSHHRCLFGQWYDDQASVGDLNGTLFDQIGHSHELFHKMGAHLIRQFRANGIIDKSEYDHFMSEVVTFNDQLRRLQSDLWGQISTNDPLTGLQSWHRLLAPVDSAEGVRQGRQQTACAAMCDLDHFKRVNDTYGHQAGDAVLRRLGECLQSGMRPNDLVYRYGGEEFLVYLIGATVDEARVVCERLRSAVEAMVVEGAASVPLRITASFGIADVEKGLRIEDIITRCDIALYAAKEHGRNRVYYWNGGEVLPDRPAP
ncbi:MAG: diguanylate cyclase [Alphaproteobacteria bacterium]|nr:diguanylate cyclase [Alphaproteobacteria bacterium]